MPDSLLVCSARSIKPFSAHGIGEHSRDVPYKVSNARPIPHGLPNKRKFNLAEAAAHTRHSKVIRHKVCITKSWQEYDVNRCSENGTHLTPARTLIWRKILALSPKCFFDAASAGSCRSFVVKPPHSCHNSAHIRDKGCHRRCSGVGRGGLFAG